MVDDTSRAGKEEKLAMEMAMEDFTTTSGGDVGSSEVKGLCMMASNGDPVRAASAALSLINERGARALVGLHSWQEAAFVAEIGRQAMVPVLSFAAAASPSASSRRWPFLVRVARGQHAQMRAVAAVVGSWQWRHVAVLYEDVDNGGGVFPHLADALRVVGSEVDRRVPVPASPSGDALQRSLGDLMGGQCRVFVVHASPKVAAALFAEASRMGMMASGYVWIVTDAIAGAVDSLDAATVSSMQGVIGVRNHNSMDTNSKNTRDHLIARFRKRFRSQYAGDEDEDDQTRGPHYPALLSYDTIVAVAGAMQKINATAPTHATEPSSPNSGETIKIAVSSDGTDLLREVKRVRLHGVSGAFGFVDGEFAPPERFQLINVVEPRYTELGFWSPEHGFSKSEGGCGGGGGCNPSMKFLGPVIWPGKPWHVPRGWAPANGNHFTVGVPEKAVFPDFVKVTYQHGRDDPDFEGFSIDVFRAAVEHLPYPFHYKFVSFNETYDSLMELGHMKSYDILVGDTSISSGRYKFVEFSQPYTESGLVMVVPFRADEWNRSWIFLRPFSPAMWLLIAVVGLYNGVAIWLMERKYNADYRGGGIWKQVTTVFWLSFTTILSPGERLRSSLSRVSMVVWLFVLVVLTTNYTASLSSLLTAQRLEEAVTAESLRAGGGMVGCTNGSVVGKYLREALLFPEHRIRRISSDDEYRRALASGEVKAVFLRVSHAKLLLAKYCNELMTTGPIYHVAGLGFVFPKGSPLLADISQAILEVFENGTIKRLETAMLSAYNCTAAAAKDGDAGDLYRLCPENYWGLFLMTLFASTASLTVYGVFFHHDTGCGGGATGCHSKQVDGRKDSATVDPGGGGAGHVDEAPLSASGSVEHAGNDTEIVVISMECEITACMPQQK
ncbi:hypothetical protein E2562_003484 [Oryza meyeriana var. granulata]|uniref:Glutamate receptor n=1 Tax=Oryza meyeriana var. granulata TaxID=110450 RepID=A0A6G1CN48_9ORYZ|nr:hypothetical protein E2562_003484 [Oryza meyeriana var. granulata]